MGIITFEEGRSKKTETSTSKYVEYFFQPGDIVFFTMLASGNDTPETQKLEKRWVDNYFMYTWPTGPNQYQSLLDHEDIDNSHVPEDVTSRMRISFWAYIYEIHHSLEHKAVVSGNHVTLLEKGIWEAIETRGGKKMYKEEVNDLRIINTNRINWEQQISQIYDDVGALNTVVMKMKKQGKGRDTRYFIEATPLDKQIPEDMLEKAETIDSIKEHFYKSYGGQSAKDEEVPEDTSNTGDLF